MIGKTLQPDRPALNGTTPIALVKVKTGRGSWLLVLHKRPCCGAKHLHGGGSLPENPRRYLSTTSPHCTDRGPRRRLSRVDLQEYVLVEAEGGAS